MVAEERPFIDAILAAPDDDAPRLVFADWLQQRGDPRGELIAVQCALEHELPWAESQRLASRQRALIRENPWTSPLREIRDGRYSWKRGFAHHVRVTAPGPLNLTQLHDAAPLLRSFTVLTLEMIDELEDWTEGLTLESALGDLSALMAELKLPRLKRLRLPAGYWHSPSDLEKGVAIDRPLEHFGLTWSYRLGPEFLAALKSGLEQRPQLGELRLEGARGIGPLGVKGLRGLELVRCDSTHGTLLAMVPGLERLEVVESDTRFARPRVDIDALLASGPELRELRLEGMALDDSTVARLAASEHAARLRRLSLPRNLLTDLSVNALIDSPHLGKLRYLNLDVNGLSRSGKKRLRARFTETEVVAH